MRKNSDGVITIKLLLAISSIMLVFLVLLNGLLSAYHKNHNLRQKTIIGHHILANYDTYLYVNYGLYGFREVDMRAQFVHSLGEDETFELKLGNSLQNPQVLSSQIEEMMTLRLPVNYLDQLLSKLEVIKTSEKTKDDIEVKTIVDTALSDLGHLFDKRISVTQKINQLSAVECKLYIENINRIKVDLLDCRGIYKALTSKIEHVEGEVDELIKSLDYLDGEEKRMTRKEIDLLKDDIESINKDLKDLLRKGKSYLDDVDDILDDLRRYHDHNSDLIDTLIKLAEQTQTTESLIEEAIVTIQNNEEGLESVKDFILDSIEDSRLALYKEENFQGQVTDAFLEYIENKSISIDKKWYPIIEIPYNNMVLLSQFQTSILEEKLSDFLHEQSGFSRTDVDSLLTYKQVKVFPPNQVDEEKKSYYKAQLKVQDQDMAIEEYITVDRDLTYSSNKKGAFWQVTLIESLNSLKDSVVLNEYIVSTFKSFADVSMSDFDYFSKYQRVSYFNKGEIEYILMGEDSETLNIMETTAVIWAVRTVMNGIHIYTDKEKLTLSESVGISVAGWTGFGAPLISNLLRVCWASGESFHDMDLLLDGESLAFYKVSPDQWYYDLGLVYESKELSHPLKLIELTYHDYLRFMLLTLSNEVKSKRIINLIELNLYKADKSFNLSSYYTQVQVGDVIRGYYE